MLNQEEKAEREQLALAKCADFEEVLTEIVYAGLEGPNPFVIYDIDGKPWRIQPREMTVADILEYVRERYGLLFLSFAKSMWQFTIH
jgi:hypothetical protein